MVYTTPTRGRGYGAREREGRRDLGSSEDESADDRYGPGFSGFASKESTLYIRILFKERILDRRIETIKSKNEEDRQNRKFQRHLRVRLSNL